MLLNRQSSEWTNVTSVVHRGSILGPLLFIMYVKYFPDQVKSFCKLFADDVFYKVLQNLEAMKSFVVT